MFTTTNKPSRYDFAFEKLKDNWETDYGIAKAALLSLMQHGLFSLSKEYKTTKEILSAWRLNVVRSRVQTYNCYWKLNTFTMDEDSGVVYQVNHMALVAKYLSTAGSHP